MRILVAAVVLGMLEATSLVAQDSALLKSRLGEETYAAVRPALDAARQDSLPVGPLEAKALEGVAKRRSPAEIAAAVQRLSARLGEARALLRVAAPGAALPDADVGAAADALLAGVPGTEISALRHETSASLALEVPLAVLAQLVQRGVPADRARGVLEQLLAANVSQARLVEIPRLMDVALQVGAPPVAALGSAIRSLGVPARPATPRDQ